MITTETIIADILRREGWPKYTNRAADKGGPTKGGITLQTLELFRDKRCTIEDLQNLTIEEAHKIYFNMFCRRYDKIVEPNIRVFLIDYAVNSGHDDSIAALQSGLRAIGAYSGSIDGVWGKGTETGIQVLNTLNLVNSIKAFKVIYKHRQDKYLGLALRERKVVQFMKDNPEVQLHNLQGWMNRLSEFH